MLKTHVSCATQDGTQCKRPKTRIICTIGPSTNSVETICDLLDAGMNCVRLNSAHGDFAFHKSIIKNTRIACQKKNTLCAVMLDIKGPEIRTMKLRPNPERENKCEWSLTAGDIFRFTTDKTHIGDNLKIATTYGNIAKIAKPGLRILASDGLFSFIVLETNDLDEVVCRIENSGVIGENKNMNLPGHVVDLPAVTEKDKGFVQFGIENNIDLIAGSFIRKAQDVIDIRALPGVFENGISIISKIENREGIDNIEEIIAESDGIMVARGDLGVEIPLPEVVAHQKNMIWLCNRAAKYVITATQMLESMITNPRPTRAEVADVYNAVIDGTDCVMLSGETANGKYPVAAVKIMTSICLEAEEHMDNRQYFGRLFDCDNHSQNSIADSVSSSAVNAATNLNAGLIVALSRSGATARLVGKYRPSCPILAVTCNPRVAAHLLLVRGVNPFLVEQIEGAEVTAEKGILKAIECSMVKDGDLLVVTSGAHKNLTGTTSMMRVAKIVNNSVEFVLM